MVIGVPQRLQNRPGVFTYEGRGASLAFGCREPNHRRIAPELAVAGGFHLLQEAVFSDVAVFVEEMIHSSVLGLDAGDIGIG